MRFVISGGLNAKVVGRAIHCLGRIGDELYIECSNEKVEFRTVNSSRSAYARFAFSRAFFAEYEDDDSQGGECIQSKIPVKSLLSVFKYLVFLEKNVEKCTMELSSDSDIFIIQLHCKYGIVKTFNLFLIDCKKIQVVYSKDDCSNNIVGEARVFYDAVQNFQPNQEEVTLVVSESRTVLKNYTEDDDLNKAIHTEVILEPQEFTAYRIGRPTELTFCLKELKAILFFTEPSNYEIALSFNTSGKPLIFALCESETTFEADFVLATTTVMNSETSSVSSDRSYQITKGNRKASTTNLKRTNRMKTASKEIQKFNSFRSNRPRLGDLIQQNKTSEVENSTDQDLDESIPGTPPPYKKIKALFRGLIETPRPRTPGEVLASDSEDEEVTS